MPSSDVAAGDSGDSSTSVIRFDEAPCYQEFFDRCLVPNRPCILPPALVHDWDVVRHGHWQKKGSGMASEDVAWDYLAEQYGKHVAPVVTLLASGDQKRQDMTIKEAVALTRAFKESEDETIRSVYIKDWHLIRQLRSTDHSAHASLAPYTVPDVFADDWMNNTASRDQDDFRFVYAGTKGSQTTLHRDVYTSYSWSTNVVGRKIWYLFPPTAIPHLRRFPAVETSQLVSDIETLHQIMAKQQQNKEYPSVQLAWDQVQIITQEQGETIFVPSDWYHQVENLEDCISINRNWCNSVNLPSLYHAIKQEIAHVETSLSDVKELLQQQKKAKNGTDAGDTWQKEFGALVQDVAIQDAGWAWQGFWDMIEHNLQLPAAQVNIRPPARWVKDRLLPLVVDFEASESMLFVNEDINLAAQRCRILLEAL